MATIHKWKCDICGKVFDEDGAGFKNRYSLGIKIPTVRGMASDEVYAYEDTCLNCREEISIVIVNKINELKSK